MKNEGQRQRLLCRSLAKELSPEELRIVRAAEDNQDPGGGPGGGGGPSTLLVTGLGYEDN